MDKDLTREEVEFIFNKIDIDQSNSIEFGEFKAWL
jgi:Ca2+-binding EF-hand superfamily protein